MRTLAASDAPEAKEAIDLFAWRVARDTGALAASLEGVDGIIFAAAGAGSLSPSEVSSAKAALSGAKPPIIMRSSRTGNGRVTGRKNFDDMGCFHKCF